MLSPFLSPAFPHLLRPPCQDLIHLICNVQAMEDAVKEMRYDTRKAPLGNLEFILLIVYTPFKFFFPPSHLSLFALGKLTASQIKSGYAALKKIESLVQAKKTSGDKIMQACDEFYTRIPHDFGYGSRT